MKKLLFILLITTPFIGFGQGWEIIFTPPVNDEFGNHYKKLGLQQTNDGGYIISGGDNDMFLTKTDGNGTVQWSQSYLLGGWSGQGHSVQQTTDGGYISVGHTNGDPYLLKTDVNGIEQWSQTYDQNNNWGKGYSVQQTTDGGYIICGERTYSSSPYNNSLIIKTDGNGIEQWNHIGGIEYGTLYSIKQTNDGGYISTGTEGSLGSLILMKTNSSGSQIWKISLVDEGGLGWEVQQTIDGGYIICGEQSNDGSDIIVIKTDENGIEQWSQIYGDYVTHVSNSGKSIQQTNDGGYVICGTVHDINYENFIYLIKIDGNGTQQWSRMFGDTCYNNGYSVQQTIDGGYIICGNSDDNIYLIKTDGNGNITSTFNIPTPSSNRKLDKVVDILGRETKPQTNTPFIEIYDDGSTEKKIVIE